jgi:hypothetical protein
MADPALTLLEGAQSRLIEAMDEIRAEGGEACVVAVVSESLAHVVPQLPGLIESRLPDVDAVIMNRATMRALLAQFAVDVLAIQSGTLRDSVRRRRE